VLCEKPLASNSDEARAMAAAAAAHGKVPVPPTPLDALVRAEAGAHDTVPM
jgi:hypothetical protein